MKLRFTPLALDDVAHVLGEVARHSPQGASKIRARLREMTQSLRVNPYLGQRTDRPLVRRRLLRPYPYVLFYRVETAEVIVVGLRHAARDPSSMPG